MLFKLQFTVASFSICSDPLVMKRPLKGFYCGGEGMLSLTGINHHDCKVQCLVKISCKVLAYDFPNMVCVIANQICSEAKINPNYEMTYFHLPSLIHSPCIAWVASTSTRNVGKGYQAVGRVIYDSKMFPGKLIIATGRSATGKTCIAAAGNERCLDGGELLTIADHCSVAWIQHNAEDPLAPRAIEGSTLPDGTPLYIAEMQLQSHIADPDNGLAYGYFNPATNTAYFGYHGFRTSTQMKLLILI